ncbi:MAG: hypothetical protein KKB63_04780, partial [Alphaproteobacteria bacterium]|nr:hypothetical protein [Alphaproteobacteria bacterium]
FIRQALDDVPTLHEAIGAVAGMMTAVEPELVAASVGIEATLGGWCSAEQRLKAVRVRRMQGMKQPEITVLPVGVHMLPTGKGLDDLLPGEADEALMVRLALAQWKVMHHFSLPMCIGGLMHLTEVTATGARQWKAGEYPDYATMRAQLHPQAAAA